MPAPPGSSTTAAVSRTAARRARSAEPRPDRRNAILLAAERLFAQRGYHAVTIRQIAEAAGVPLALVGYYFGQKHELFAALFDHWSTTIDERLAGLRAVQLRAGDGAALRAIVEAFVWPVVRLRASAEGESYALLVGRQLVQDVDEADAVMRRHFDPMARAFIDALQAVHPWASRGEVAWGYQFALGALLHHLSDARVERLSDGANRAADPAAAPRLIDFIVGGLCAALPAPPSVDAPHAPASSASDGPDSPDPITRPERQETAP